MPCFSDSAFSEQLWRSRGPVLVRGEFMPILRPRFVTFCSWMVLVAAASAPLTLAQVPGNIKDTDSLFATHCASCHAQFNATRAPWPDTLRLMTKSAILSALESGKMKAIGDGMSHEQRVAVASYLGKAEVTQKSSVNSCPENSAPMANSPVWNGWGADLSNSRFQPEKAAGSASLRFHD
jgi:polyvinyl alcohol dehydrogenase (cytochrome)